MGYDKYEELKPLVEFLKSEIKSLERRAETNTDCPRSE